MYSNQSGTYLFPPTPVQTAYTIILHNYDEQPAMIAVQIDSGGYENFMINMNEHIDLLPITMSNTHFIYIRLQSENPT